MVIPLCLPLCREGECEFCQELVMLPSKRLLQSPHKPTTEERASERRYGWSHAPRVDYTPSGRLRLQVCRVGGVGANATWSDTERRPLERRIGDIAVGLEVLAESIKEDRRRAQEEKRRFEEQWARREAEARRQESEKKRFEELRSEAARWNEAKVLREYVDAVEQRYGGTPERTDLAESLAWARGKVEEFDPLVEAAAPSPAPPGAEVAGSRADESEL